MWAAAAKRRIDSCRVPVIVRVAKIARNVCMQQRRALRQRSGPVRDGGQVLVIDHDQLARVLCGVGGLG